MIDKPISILGIQIPSRTPLFLAFVGVHITAALICVSTGIGAMLVRKGGTRHRKFGRIYYWSILVVALSAVVLSLMRWSQDYHLFILGILSFVAAFLGRMSLQRRWTNWIQMHIIGMGVSFILLLIAFYVDNGKNLPVWRNFPPITYWLLPSIVGIPLIFIALKKHPPSRYSRKSGGNKTRG